MQEIHKRLKRLFCDVRHKMVDEGKDIDFPTAEAMAVGSLLKDGTKLVASVHLSPWIPLRCSNKMQGMM